MDEQYNELWKMWEARYGAYPLGIIGKRYFLADFIKREFQVLVCKADRRTSTGYSYKVHFATNDYEQMKNYIQSN